MTNKTCLVQNNAAPNLPALRARWCASFASRLRGFTFRKNIAPDEGLILVEARESRVDTAIHMLFVWTDLAVFWLDNDLRVVDKTLAKAWWPFYAPRRPARYTLEAAPARLDDFQIGDSLRLLDA
ncbi:MAG: DUF192 domain-containing protein [Anaerolineales bacterium]